MKTLKTIIVIVTWILFFFYIFKGVKLHDVYYLMIAFIEYKCGDFVFKVISKLEVG